MRGGKREGAGRKKGIASILAEKTRDYIAKRVAKENNAIVTKAVEQAKEGNQQARDWLYNRAYGAPQQHVDHTSDGKELPTPILAHVSGDDSTHKD